ncbi:MAG TPA: hypothetical protein VGN20_18900 [Mucilaginibacter sp.]|jgi:hypothetical protein
MVSILQKYYAFYLKCIFLQSPVRIDAFATIMKTQKPMAVLAIDELRNNGYVILEDDLIKLTPKGLAYLVSNNLISVAQQERATGVENVTVDAEKRTPTFRIKTPRIKLKMPVINLKMPATLKMPAVKLKMPALNLRIPTIRIKTPAMGIKNSAIAIINDKRPETLAWIVGILCIAVVIGLILAG